MDHHSPISIQDKLRLRQFAENGQYEMLAAACRKHLSSHAPELYPLIALALAHRGDTRGAGEFIDTALDPEIFSCLGFESRLDLAGAMLARGDMGHGEKLLEDLLEQGRDHPLVLARHGWCLMAKGESEAAGIQFKKSAALDPSRPEVWTNLAILALDREDVSAALEAVSHGEKALGEKSAHLSCEQICAKGLTLDRLRIQCLVRRHFYAQAEALLADIRDKEEDYIPRLMAYSNALAEQDCHDQAGDAVSRGVALFPENTTLLVHLGELERVQGHYSQAIQAIKKAISLDKDNPNLWSTLSMICLDRFDTEARKAAEKAIALSRDMDQWIGPGYTRIPRARAKTALAKVESRDENFNKSEPLFIQVLEEIPDFIPALQGLGQQYMQEGRIDEALAIYKKIEKIDPIEAQSALIHARMFPEDDAVLEELERTARMPSIEGRVRSGLLFQVAAAWEKRQHYDKAFEFACQANGAGRKFLSYDKKAHRNFCFRVRERFCRNLFHHRKGCGLGTDLPVYVLGMPRSGTTLVEQIIAGHTRIFGAGELGTIPQRIQGLNRWERHVGSKRSYPDCMDDLTPYISKGIAKGILAELTAFDPGASHIVDKLPHNFENIGFIKFLFPRAKIISVRRDPRDIAVSNYFTDYMAKHHGMGFAYDLTDIGEQLADHNRLMHHWHTLFPGEILEIRYEDVVDDLEESARKLLDYIGVEWEPDVLKFNELQRPVKTASVWQVRQPIYTTSKNRWEHYSDKLSPLIKSTNAPILPDPIDDMITLPLPGFLQDGVNLFQQGDLDGAELCLKKMLHHNPDHAACTYMTGLIYCRKGHLADGADLMARALEKAPWHREWRDNLIQAYADLGRLDEADQLNQGPPVLKAEDDLHNFLRDPLPCTFL